MILQEKNKAYLIVGISLSVILILMLLIGEILLPFILAIFIAYLLNPLILKVQNKLKNRNLAITSFLFVFSLVLFAILFLFGGHIVKDSKRLVSAVQMFTDENQNRIEEIKNNVLDFVDKASKSEAVKSQIESLENISLEDKEEDLVSAIGSVYSFFTSSTSEKEVIKSKPWSPFYILLYTIFYTVLILYTYDYFQDKYARYFDNRIPSNSRLEGIWDDFKISFLDYFRQRAKVVMINIIIFIVAFSIFDLPGAIIIGIIAGILSYASHFHYLSLPMVAVGSWVLSIEHNPSFYLYFGILLLVFVLVSVLEETLYFDKIMKSVNGMNPAIMLLAFALWISVFGGIAGTIIALPLTQLILIYLDRMMLFSKEKIKEV